MKKRSTQAIVAAAILLLTSGLAAQAKEDDDNGKGCSKATLHGLYVFHASGFNIAAGTGVAQPKAIVEVIQFNGDGTLTVPMATVSINGVVGRSPPGGTGLYAVAQDCSGSLAFDHGPAFDLFVGKTASELYLIQTGPGLPVFQGTADRVSH